MRDAFDELSELHDLDVRRLSAAQVRARGDRRRRRRSALTITGAVAAVATVGFVVDLVGGLNLLPPEPAIALTIPVDVPLAVQLPVENVDGTRVEVTGSPGVEPLDLCGQTALSAPEATDVAGVGHTSDESYRGRVLFAFASEAEATEFIARTGEEIAACPRARVDGHTLLVDPVDATLGDESVAFTTRRNSNSGRVEITAYDVARHDNLVLITSQSGQARNTDQSRVSAAAAAGEVAGDVFSAVTGDSAASDGPVTPALVPSIPTDFPLDLDLGRFQEFVDGPGPGGTGLRSFTVCGPSGWTVGPRERLAANLLTENLTDDRELRTYATESEAVAQLSSIRSAAKKCVGQNNDGGRLTLFDEEAGDEAVTFSETYDGESSGNVLQFVRVGTAILATSYQAEFKDRDRVGADLARERTELARKIAARMCVFTDVGC